MSVLCLRDSVSAYDLIRFLFFSSFFASTILPYLIYSPGWFSIHTMLMPSRRRSVAGCVSDSVEGNDDCTYLPVPQGRGGTVGK